MEIDERRQVRVTKDDRTFVFLADPDRGRLVLREEHGDGDDVCALTIADPEELSGFLEGLRRVLGSPRDGGHEDPAVGHSTAAARGPDDGGGGGGARSRPGDPPDQAQLAPAAKEDREEEDRDAAIARARERDPKAFQPWTPDEEQRLAEAFRAGRTTEELAQHHGRSRRAIEMRLEKLGLRSGG